MKTVSLLKNVTKYNLSCFQVYFLNIARASRSLWKEGLRRNLRKRKREKSIFCTALYYSHIHNQGALQKVLCSNTY